MKSFLYSLWLDIKLIIKSLPKLFLTTFILTILICGIVVFANNTVYKDASHTITDVVVYVPGDSEYNDIGISFIKNMDSFSSICTLKKVDSIDKGYSLLERGNVLAFIIIPESFVNDIQTGEDTPARIIFSNNASIEEHLLKELITSGSSLLLNVQAGIYTVYDVYVAKEYSKEDIKSSNKEINSIYIKYALTREHSFNRIGVSATNNINILEYYISSGLVVIILLSGIALSSFLSAKNKSLIDKYCICGIKKPIILLQNIIALFIGYIAIYYTLIWLLIAFTKKTISDQLYIYPSIYISSLPVLLLTATIVTCIYTLANHNLSGMLLLFIATLVSVFISGGFIPLGFLPKAIQNISHYVPTTYMIKQIALGISDITNNTNVFIILVWTFSIYFVTSIIKERT